MSMINPKTVLAATTVVGAAGGTAIAATRSDSDSALDKGVGAAVGGGVGFVAGRYGGPQASWALAERAVKGKHNNEMEVLRMLKTGKILDMDQGRLFAKNVQIVQKADQAIMRAAAPKLWMIGGVAALTGAGAAYAATAMLSKIGD